MMGYCAFYCIPGDIRAYILQEYQPTTFIKVILIFSLSFSPSGETARHDHHMADWAVKPYLSKLILSFFFLSLALPIQPDMLTDYVEIVLYLLYFELAQGKIALIRYGPPADKRDLTTKYENLNVMHILKILSMKSHS